MAQIKVVSCVLIVCLMLFLISTDGKMALSPEEIISQDTSCCREHPEIGKCDHGKDDAPDVLNAEEENANIDMDGGSVILVYNKTDIRPCMCKILKCSNETSVKSGVGEQLPIMQGQFGFVLLT
ncbi:hypothetical protein ACOSQ4_020743 [Xanthoceras sorbifolium]